MRTDYTAFERLAESHEDIVRRAVRVELVLEYLGTVCLVLCIVAGVLLGNAAVAATFSFAALVGVLRSVPLNWWHPTPVSWWSRVLAIVLSASGLYIVLRAALITMAGSEWLALGVTGVMVALWMAMVHIEVDHRREAERNWRLATSLRPLAP